MAQGSLIKSVSAREIFSERGHPGVEATVVTENGGTGVAVATAGVSVGKHEVQFVYDGGTRYGGLGVQRAVSNVNNIIASALKGKDATKQREIDEIIIKLDGTPNKTRLGGNATASVSAAVLKAGAASLGLPLYQHIGGVNACILPTPGVVCMVGSDRYGGGQRSGGKPSYAFMAYGFKSFSEAAHACWHVENTFEKLLHAKYHISATALRFPTIPAGYVQHEREIWDLMAEAIDKVGYKNKVGIQIDVAAGTYYEKDKDKFVGLFSKEDKTKEDLIQTYKDMVASYPFVIVEDPLDEDDYEGHAIVTKELNKVEVTGDDLFTTNIERLRKGIEVGACNTALLKVNQIGTISEAFDYVQLAYKHGYGVQPCSSRGEGAALADYCVGLNTGQVRESALDAAGNRLLEIEQELGSRARFLGKAGFKP